MLVYFPVARALFESLKPRKDGSNRGGRSEVPLALGPQSGRGTPTGTSSPKPEPIDMGGGGSGGMLSGTNSPKQPWRSADGGAPPGGSSPGGLHHPDCAHASPAWVRDGRFAPQLRAGGGSGGGSPLAPDLAESIRAAQGANGVEGTRLSHQSRTSTMAVWHGVSSPLVHSPVNPSSRRDSSKSGSHLSSTPLGAPGGVVTTGGQGNYAGNFGGGPSGHVGAPRGEEGERGDTSSIEYFVRNGIPRIGAPRLTESTGGNLTGGGSGGGGGGGGGFSGGHEAGLAPRLRAFDASSLNRQQPRIGRRMTWSDRHGARQSPLVVLGRAPQRPRAKSTPLQPGGSQPLEIAYYRDRRIAGPAGPRHSDPAAGMSRADGRVEGHSSPANQHHSPSAQHSPSTFVSKRAVASSSLTDEGSLNSAPPLLLPSALRGSPSREIAAAGPGSRRSSDRGILRRRGSSESNGRGVGVGSSSRRASGASGNSADQGGGSPDAIHPNGLATHHEAEVTSCDPSSTAARGGNGRRVSTEMEWIDTHTGRRQSTEMEWVDTHNGMAGGMSAIGSRRRSSAASVRRRSSAISLSHMYYPRRVSGDARSVRSSSITSQAFAVDTTLCGPRHSVSTSGEPASRFNDSVSAEELENQMRDAQSVSARRRLLLWPRRPPPLPTPPHGLRPPPPYSEQFHSSWSPPTPPSPLEDGMPACAARRRSSSSGVPLWLSQRRRSSASIMPAPPHIIGMEEDASMSPSRQPSSNIGRVVDSGGLRARLANLPPLPSVPLPLISPDSPLRTCWLLGVILAMLATAFVLPYRLGFTPTHGPGAAHAVRIYGPLEASCDVVFTADLLLNARLSYWLHNGVVIDPYTIFQRYATTPSQLPLNIVALISGIAAAASGYAQPWVRAPMLIRLLQLPSVIDEFVRQLSRGQRSDNYSLRKLCTLLGLAIFIVHITACLHGVAFGVAYGKSDDLIVDTTTASPNATLHASDTHALPAFHRTYTYAIWWTASALSALGAIPTPQPLGQLAFSTAVLLGALLTTVYLVAQLGVLIQNLDASALTYRKKRNATELFVRRQGLTPELAARVVRYQQLSWVRGAGCNLRTVVDQMNPTIRADIMHHICHAVVIAVPLFMGCEPKLIFLLMEAMKHDVYVLPARPSLSALPLLHPCRHSPPHARPSQVPAIGVDLPSRLDRDVHVHHPSGRDLSRRR